MRKFLIAATSLLLLGSVVSCMTNDVLMVPTATDSDLMIGGDQGILLVQVADTAPYGMRFPINGITLAPEDVNDNDANKFLRLDAAEGHQASTQFFYSVLPANDYALDSFRSFYVFGDSYFSYSYPVGIDLGTFTIEPGKVTDLGTIAVYIRRSGEDYMFDTARSTAPSRTMTVFRDAAPELASRATNLDDPLTWHPDGNDSQRDATYANAVNRQVILAEPFIDESSDILLYPSRLGVFVERTGAGEWTLDALPDDAEIRWVTLVGSNYVAVTEFNEVFVRGSGMYDWSKIQPPGGDGELLYIAEHATYGVIAVRQSKEIVSIWLTRTLGDSWTIIGSLEAESGWTDIFKQPTVGISGRPAGIGQVLSGDDLFIQFGRDVYRFSLASRTFEEMKLPGIDSMNIRNGIITVGMSPAPSLARVSFDNGQSWIRPRNFFVERRSAYAKTNQRLDPRDLPDAKLIGHPIFLDSQRGYAVHDGKKTDGSAFLVATSNGAEYWVSSDDFAPLPPGCAGLELATEEELLLSCFISGEFYRSTDGGRSWQPDRVVTET